MGARPVTAEFTNGIADARSFQPLRLSVDLGGRERTVQLAIDLPSGGRIAPELAEFTAGGRVHVQVLNVYVPAGTNAGTYTVRGTVRDGLQRWPFEAAVRIRANARLIVRDEDVGFATVRAAETVHRVWRVTNTGNVLLQVLASAQPATGARVSVAPVNLTLAPGEHREITLTARLELPPNRLVTMPFYLNVDSGTGSQRRRETVGFTAEFVPQESGTGPLFAELNGEAVVGGVAARDHRGMAGRIQVAGEVLPGVNLLAQGTDGTAAPGGSHLGLATRDYFTLDLRGAAWRTTGGLVDPPPFGFLESSTQGRGGTLAWSDDSGLTVTALAAREHFGDFSRTHAGLHAEQLDPDRTGWAAGLLAQRNTSGPNPAQERAGGFAATHWEWRGLVGATQLAAAQDAAGGSARLGVEQRLDYRSADERANVAVFVQQAPAGFFLGGRSTELRDAAAGHTLGEFGRFDLHWSDSRQRGLLRSYSQSETEAGLTPTDPNFVELITRTGSRDRSQSASYEFTPGENRARVTFSDTRRTRESSLARGLDESYREHVLATDLSRTLGPGRFLFSGTLALGTEANATQQANFAETALNASGQVTERLQFSAEIRHTWHTGGTASAGYRQPGTYGRGSLVWSPLPRWRVETGFDAYQFSHFAGRTRSFALVEAPLTPRVALATEVSHDNERTSLWLAARVTFSAPMPWRPVRGAITGRVREMAGGTPVAGARLDLGGRAGLTAADGRFTLPGRRPGTYPFTWSLPADYMARPDWPRTVAIRAGQVQVLELAAERIASLSGTIEITRGTAIERPTGSISATDDDGRIFEAMAATGDFRLLLPPGRYVVRYTGEVAPALAIQLVAVVQVGTTGEPALVRLTASEELRGMRRTFYRDEAAPDNKPALP